MRWEMEREEKAEREALFAIKRFEENNLGENSGKG